MTNNPMDMQYGNGWLDKLGSKLGTSSSNKYSPSTVTTNPTRPVNLPQQQPNSTCANQIDELKKEIERLNEMANKCKQDQQLLPPPIPTKPLPLPPPIPAKPVKLPPPIPTRPAKPLPPSKTAYETQVPLVSKPTPVPLPIPSHTQAVLMQPPLKKAPSPPALEVPVPPANRNLFWPERVYKPMEGKIQKPPVSAPVKKSWISSEPRMQLKSVNKGKKIFVFDFECTLTSSHWFYFLHNFDRWKKEYLVKNQKANIPNAQLFNLINRLHKVSNNANDFIHKNSKLNKEELINEINMSLKSVPELKADQQFIIDYIMGGNTRRNLICTLIQTLVKNGFDVAIVSKGFYIDIIIFLALMGIDGVKIISAQHDCKYLDNGQQACEYTGKETFIPSLFSDYEKVRFVNDNAQENNEFSNKLSNNDYKFYGPKANVTNSKNALGISFTTEGLGLMENDIDMILKDNDITKRAICNLPEIISPTNAPISIPKQNLTKLFVFDFDCTLTYSHWFYFIHRFDHWAETFLKNFPYFKKLSHNDQETKKSELKTLSKKILNFVATNNKLDMNQYTDKAVNYLQDKEKELLYTNIMGGKNRLEKIVLFIQTLIDNRYDIAIASRGYFDDIRFFLAIINVHNIQIINAQHDCNYDAEKIPKDCKYMDKEEFVKYAFNTKYNEVRYADDDPKEHKNLLPEIGNKDYKYYGPQNLIQNTKNSLGLSFKTNGNGLTTSDIQTILSDNDIIRQIGGNQHSEDLIKDKNSLSYQKYKKYKKKYMMAKYNK